MTSHPLAYLAGILWAGLATVGFIAGYLMAGASIRAALRWWRGGARRLDRVQKLAALDNAARTPVRREDHGDPRHWPGCTKQAHLSDLVVNAEFERIAERLHYESVRDMLDGGDEP